MLNVLGIQQIEQDSNHTFWIKWTDGTKKHYRLADLQRACPCASCHEEQKDPSLVPDDLTATRIHSVGRYGIGILFSSGCSAGIFGYDQLNALGTVIE